MRLKKICFIFPIYIFTVAFVLVFEQTILLITQLLSAMIPVRSKDTEDQRKRARYLANEASHVIQQERSVKH